VIATTASTMLYVIVAATNQRTRRANTTRARDEFRRTEASSKGGPGEPAVL